MGNGSNPFLIFRAENAQIIILFEIPGEGCCRKKGEDKKNEYDCFEWVDLPEIQKLSWHLRKRDKPKYLGFHW